MNISKILFLALALLAAPALAEGENETWSARPVADTADPVGLADPSSVYCEELGYECVDGDCIFPDGTSCPTWDFYRGKCGQSFTRCELEGYRIESRVEDVGTFSAEYAVCVFDDCSECSEQSRLDGECSPSNCNRWTLKEGCEPPVEHPGLISKVARINSSAGTSAGDVLGWEIIYRDEDGKCRQYYVAQAPLIGMIRPEEATCPQGVRAFDRYMVDYEEAIAIMQSMDCGATFAELSLFWPMTPEAEEPQWRIKTSLGDEIVIGANCRRAECVKAECSTEV
ncbi:DUF333 domain-containing protein [Methanocrinis sp.]|uniref:DUF333 domain-containing protein n=1 Tax=Methanocrinis sp. TaxID=3101522 RepID=UPI003D0CAEB2